MAIYLENVGTRSRGDVFEWKSSQSILYALGVGVGSAGLALVTENSRGVVQQALPTMAAVLGTGEARKGVPLGDFQLHQILHAGQALNVHQTLQPSGRAVIESGMTAVYDKGRNAIIESTSTVIDADSGQPIADLVMQMLVRGEGGFGGDPGGGGTWSVPERPADEVIVMQTSPDQALIYRLSGDLNPLHSDPVTARDMGFAAPILHGLCTWGFTSRALLEFGAGNDVERFGSYAARFASPVIPGDALAVHMWQDDGLTRFQTRVGDTVVLDRGEFTTR